MSTHTANLGERDGLYTHMEFEFSGKKAYG